MAVNLKGRSFLSLADFTPEELRYLLDLGHDLKAKRRAGVCAPTMQGKHIVLLFEKTSTRTRCSFEVAATQEGAHVTYLDAGSSQMGKKESLEDSAKVLGRFFDGIEYRGYEQSVALDRMALPSLSSVRKGAAIVAMCIEGKQISSDELAQFLADRANSGAGDVAFVIGSSHGLSDEVKKAAALKFSMGRITMPHQLARLVLTEQIYRACTINVGMKYHK